MKRLIWFLITFSSFSLTNPVVAGPLQPPAGPNDPASAMYTLEDLYNRLNNGSDGNKRSEGFVEPASTPAPTGHTLNEIMEKAPMPDNVQGATPGNVLSGKTFWGLRTDGTWGPKVGTGTNLNLGWKIKTWAGGTRFTDNGDGTVTDNKTDLIWLKNANCFEKKTWDNAHTVAAGLASGSCGLTDGSVSGDWRLPTIDELESLVDRAFYSPALSNAAGTAKWTEGGAFSGVQTYNYWSSTSNANYASYAWYVNLDYGYVNGYGKTGDLYVWPVRGGQ